MAKHLPVLAFLLLPLQPTSAFALVAGDPQRECQPRAIRECFQKTDESSCLKLAKTVECRWLLGKCEVHFERLVLTQTAYDYIGTSGVAMLASMFFFFNAFVRMHEPAQYRRECLA